MRDSALFLHHYPAYTWETMMGMQSGIWRVMVREAKRQTADTAHMALVIHHTGDAKDLEERLHYAARPEDAYWLQPKDDDSVIEAALAKTKRM